MLEHATAAGNALLKAKAALPHGRWLPWLKSKCDLSERMAQNYMVVAQGRDTLTKTQRVADLSLRGALRLLKPPSPKASGSLAAPSKAAKPATSFDALGWWTNAALDQRRHFLDGIGLNPLLAAMPDTWRPEIMRRAAESKTASTIVAVSPPPASTATTAEPSGDDGLGVPGFLVDVAKERDRKRRENKSTEPAREQPARVAPHTLTADERAKLDALETKIREIQNANLNRKPREFRKLNRLREQHTVLAKRLGVYRLPAFEGDGARP